MLLFCSHNQYMYLYNNITVWIRYKYPRFQHSLEEVEELLWNSYHTAIFEVSSYFLGTDDDGTSRSLCIILSVINP